MDFYFDENIPKFIARALNELEKISTDINVKSTEDVWGKAIKDPELIVNLNENNGILITNDLKMKRVYCELLKENQITAFFISLPSGSSYEIRYRTIINKWEEIKKICRNNKHPFLCKIKMRGQTEIT